MLQKISQENWKCFTEAQQNPKTKKNDSSSSKNNKNNDGLNKEVEYTKSSFKSIRSAINRHLTDIKRNINIVKDDIFRTANCVLNEVFKEKVRSGKSRPVQQKKRL
ncbi:hypothetical protein KUTeg_021607 [Tegillarca granosa]|uniref:Uncharacterized protein n=1 Tax=Tegillarca granosa TaxID=220873 RepID=A0ABQ9E9W7_TEGGR|nr:hypothetical protein KUTeg_021607 [Tegillarca granosa]